MKKDTSYVDMKSSRFRILAMSVSIFLFALVLIARLYMLQIVNAEDYQERADRQYVKSAGSLFDRGSIYFSDKDGNVVSAAGIKTGFTIAINPKKITNPQSTCEKIKVNVASLNCEDFVNKANDKNASYKEVAKRISEEEIKPVMADILDKDLVGVSVYKDKWRYYPADSLASHVLGFVAFKGNDLEGRYGLERTYEQMLERKQKGAFVNFFAEMFSNIESTVSESESLEGDIITTIEPTVQAYLESELEKIQQKYQSENVGGLIMNPKNGEIYAMAVKPDFNLNEFNLETNPAIYSNDMVESVKEMGSIVKPITMAVGIDTGKVTAETKYNDRGVITVENKGISNFDGKGRGMITMQEALGKSLNTGFVYVEQQIGNKVFADYFKAFGLDKKSGIDLPNEAAGLTKNLESPRSIEYATASFGQGIAFNPIVAARAISVLANGGYLVTPHIAKSIKYKLGYTKDIQYPIGEQVIKKETSEAITRMLVADFDIYFQDGRSKNPQYSIAEKTGTAQIALPNGRGYYEDKYLHTFFGYLPAYDSNFLVLLYNTNPQGVLYSSESLGPTFVEISQFLIDYYQIPPDR